MFDNNSLDSRSLQPVHHPDDERILGYVRQDVRSWQALTIFAYPFARATSRSAAEREVRMRGLEMLLGVWSYYDEEESQWFPCIINDANLLQVTIVRTDEMGLQHPDTIKHVLIKEPSETNLVKA